MFRTIIGIALLAIGIFVMSGALAATHGNPPTDPKRWNTWGFWSICIGPLAAALWMLFGPSLRRLRRR